MNIVEFFNILSYIEDETLRVNKQSTNGTTKYY